MEKNQQQSLVNEFNNNDLMKQQVQGLLDAFQKKAAESIKNIAALEGVSETDIMFAGRGGNHHFYTLLQAAFKGYAMKFECAETDVQFAINFKEQTPGKGDFQLFTQIYRDYEPVIDFRFLEAEEQTDLDNYIVSIVKDITTRHNFVEKGFDYGDLSLIFYRLEKDEVIRLGVFMPDAEGALGKVETILPDKFDINGPKMVYFEIWKKGTLLRPANFALDVLGMSFPIDDGTEKAMRFILGGNAEMNLPQFGITIPARKGRIYELAEKLNLKPANVMVGLFMETDLEAGTKLNIDAFEITNEGQAVRKNLEKVLFEDDTVANEPATPVITQEITEPA